MPSRSLPWEHQLAVAFDSCGELSDPTFHWVKSTLTLIVLVWPCRVYQALVKYPNEVFTVLIVHLLLTSISAALAYGLYQPILKTAFKKKKVVFLRAFSSDEVRDDQTFRNVLRAALDKKFKLIGIRPPSVRVSIWTRLVGDFFTALRYLGSNTFELEAADHNWLARLLATLATSQAVVLDIRKIPLNGQGLHTEVCLALKLSDSRNRLFILVDTSKSQAEWWSELQQILEDSPLDDEKFQFLHLPDGWRREQEDIAFWLRQKLSSIPDRPFNITPQVLSFAKDQVKQNGYWHTPFWESPWLVTSWIFILQAGLTIYYPSIATKYTIGLGILFVIMLVIGYARLLGSSIVQKRLGGSPDFRIM
jgi:hypothetical protein